MNYSADMPVLNRFEDKMSDAIKQKIAAEKNYLEGTPIPSILEERGERYGDFKDHANLTQMLKINFYLHMERHNKEHVLNSSQKEALDMIFHKLGRIGNGDPNYKDSWVDIAGYATLVAQELK